MDGGGFFQLIDAFENALTDMRANALFPKGSWLQSAEGYRQKYKTELDALAEGWRQDPHDLDTLLSLCAHCRDHYAQGETDIATGIATEINALLYRVKTKTIAS